MYSPKIAEDLIPLLYRLKQRLGKPGRRSASRRGIPTARLMTQLVNEILRTELAEMETIYLTDELEEPDEYGIDRATL